MPHPGITVAPTSRQPERILLGYIQHVPVWFDTALHYTTYGTPDRPVGVPRHLFESMDYILGLSWPRPPPPPPVVLPPEGHPQVRPPLPKAP